MYYPPVKMAFGHFIPFAASPTAFFRRENAKGSIRDYFATRRDSRDAAAVQAIDRARLL